MGGAACLPQEFASLLNSSPFGKESSALYKQLGVGIAPEEAWGCLPRDFGECTPLAFPCCSL